MNYQRMVNVLCIIACMASFLNIYLFFGSLRDSQRLANFFVVFGLSWYVLVRATKKIRPHPLTKIIQLFFFIMAILLYIFEIYDRLF